MSVTPAVPSTDVATTAEPRPRCPVCDHDLAAHDSVSRRYCLATQSRALTRNCICSSWS